MSEHRHTYQAMFLLDNQEVRQGFTAARDWVKSTLEKHGLDVKVLRLWGERPLAYKVRGRRRATYLLGWLEGSGESVNKVKREMYLLGPVFRCLFLQEDEIPAEELAFGVEDVDEASLVIPEDEPEPEFEDYIEEESDDEDGAPRRMPAAGGEGEKKDAEPKDAEPKDAEKKESGDESGEEPKKVAAAAAADSDKKEGNDDE